jgi:succinyl-CoA synthetase alpha subunit
MSIFINKATRVLVQGMTGSEGTKHTKKMLASGTNIVGGVTPGKGGMIVDMGGHLLPVFNTVQEAVAATQADTSVVFVPPKFAKSAVIDAIDAALPLVVVITEGIPVHDTAAFLLMPRARQSRASLVRTAPELSHQVNQTSELSPQISLSLVPLVLSQNLGL